MISCSIHRGAFTFVDLVVVTVMLIIGAATAMPAFINSREGPNEAICRSNLREIGIALNSYDAQFTHLPQPAGTDDAPELSILTQLVPFLEGEPTEVGTTEIHAFRCPSDNSFVAKSGGTSYGINIRGWYKFGSSGESFTSLATIPAGSSNVIAAGDLAQAGTYLWNAPNYKNGTSEGEYNGYYGAKPASGVKTGPGSGTTAADGSGLQAPLFSSYHSGGHVNVLLFDAHVFRANIQGSANKGSASGIAGGTHPALGNTTGVYYENRIDWEMIAIIGGAGVVILGVLAAGLIIFMLRRKPKTPRPQPFAGA